MFNALKMARLFCYLWIAK